MKKLEVGSYERTIHEKPVTFTCKDCGQLVTEMQYPGPKKTLCITCFEDPERERRLARERKRRQRERQKANTNN
jgi:hypothetical protein